MLLSICESDEVYSLVLTQHGELNWSHVVKEIEKTCLINVEKKLLYVLSFAE